jgi:hypothetical protein
MKRLKTKMILPVMGLGALGLTMGTPALAYAQGSGSTTYTANLQPVPLNTPSGAASGTLTLTLTGNQAQITENVTGLATTLPTDTSTLASLGIPAAFAGKPFPHVQHIHGGAAGTCPTAAADANHDGLITTAEAQPNYGPILTTLSVAPGGTANADGTNVTIAPSGGSFTYNRTITLDQTTLQSIKAGNAVIVVHGLNPANAPKASLTTPNSVGLTLPGESKPVAAIATAPALCGTLTASQMSAVPSGAPQTGGGSTAGFQDGGLVGFGGALLLGGAGVLAFRRRKADARS